MTSSTGADLPVPDEAKRAYDEVIIGLLAVSKGMCEPGPATFEDNIRAIAAPVVAAELRRLADAETSDYPDYDTRDKAEERREFAARLRARADALDADPR